MRLIHIGGLELVEYEAIPLETMGHIHTNMKTTEKENACIATCLVRFAALEFLNFFLFSSVTCSEQYLFMVAA